VRRLLALAAAVLGVAGAACAARPPLVERWTVVLVDQGGFTVLHTQTMTAPLYPVLTYSDCPAGPIVRTATERRCSGLEVRRRAFLLFYTDPARHAALYREEGPWSSD
jgi:hypothetical protein